MTGEEAVVAPPAPLTGPAGELGVDEADHGEATVEWSTHGLGPEKRLHELTPPADARCGPVHVERRRIGRGGPAPREAETSGSVTAMTMEKDAKRA